jgi:glutamine synthetase
VGLDGIARRLDPGPSADSPYDVSAEPLPKTLEEALKALRKDDCFRAGFGEAFVKYYTQIKDAEIARFRKDSKDNKGSAEVSDWEQREYFDMF